MRSHDIHSIIKYRIVLESITQNHPDFIITSGHGNYEFPSHSLSPGGVVG